MRSAQKDFEKAGAVIEATEEGTRTLMLAAAGERARGSNQRPLRTI